MNLTTLNLCAIGIQAAAVLLIALKLRAQVLGKLGFLFMATTFVYHGASELLQGFFPGRNQYRLLTGDEALSRWLWLITATTCLFTATYLLKVSVNKPRLGLERLLRDFKGAYFLKWPVLLSLGLGAMIMVTIRRGSAGNESYLLSGLADQFNLLILTLSLATLTLTTRGKHLILTIVLYGVTMSTVGQRTFTALTILLAMSAAVRYGVEISRRTIGVIVVVIATAFIAISASRSDHGRFSEESFQERLEAIISGLNKPVASLPIDDVLDDTVYRLDGNSYGALILDKQMEGYGVTGLRGIGITLAYMVPSFIYTEKYDLDPSMRNEEAYADQFYALDGDVDFVADFWNMVLAYSGALGLLFFGALLGWGFASLDNWLSTTMTVNGYLAGVALSMIPMNLELGVAGIPMTLRGLVALLVVANLLRVRKAAAEPGPRRAWSVVRV